MRIRRTAIAALLAAPLALTACAEDGIESGPADSVVREGGEGAEQVEEEEDDDD